MIEMHAACSRPRILLVYEQSISGLAIDQGCAPAEWSTSPSEIPLQIQTFDSKNAPRRPEPFLTNFFFLNEIYEQL
jgi:hypothetical protein